MSEQWWLNSINKISTEPLTPEKLQRLLQRVRDERPEPPVEIMSPAEYARRLSEEPPCKP